MGLALPKGMNSSKCSSGSGETLEERVRQAELRKQLAAIEVENLEVYQKQLTLRVDIAKKQVEALELEAKAKTAMGSAGAGSFPSPKVMSPALASPLKGTDSMTEEERAAFDAAFEQNNALLAGDD